MGMALVGLGAFKTMFDLAKGLKDISDATTRNAVAIELQEKILTAQAQQTALIQQVSTLEAEVAQLKAWGAEKQRYKLERLEPGVFVYALKPEMAAGEPAHQICQKCYEAGKRMILQSNERSQGNIPLRAMDAGPSCWLEHIARNPSITEVEAVNRGLGWKTRPAFFLMDSTFAGRFVWECP